MKKLSDFLALVAWISVFVLSWILVLRIIPFDLLSGSFWAIFFLVALFSSALASRDKRIHP